MSYSLISNEKVLSGFNFFKSVIFEDDFLKSLEKLSKVILKTVKALQAVRYDQNLYFRIRF